MKLLFSKSIPNRKIKCSCKTQVGRSRLNPNSVSGAPTWLQLVTLLKGLFTYQRMKTSDFSFPLLPAECRQVRLFSFWGLFCPEYPLCLKSYFQTLSFCWLVHTVEIWFILMTFLLNPHFLQAFTLFLWQLDRIAVLSTNLRELSLSFCFKPHSIKEHTPVDKKLGLGLLGGSTLCHRYTFPLGLGMVLCQGDYSSIPSQEVEDYGFWGILSLSSSLRALVLVSTDR